MTPNQPGLYITLCPLRLLAVGQLPNGNLQAMNFDLRPEQAEQLAAMLAEAASAEADTIAQSDAAFLAGARIQGAAC